MPARVLIVDDNVNALEMAGFRLRTNGINVEETTTGSGAIKLLLSSRFDLALIDFKLPDMTGFDVVRAMKAGRRSVPWVLVSGFLDFDVAAEAGRLGALRVVPIPYNVEEVVSAALNTISGPEPSDSPTLSLPQPSIAHTAAERWAHFVVRACEADGDLKTIAEWASFVGASESTLVAACRILQLSPRDSRDFMRVLRALLRRAGALLHLEAELSISDPRTYSALLDRAGLRNLQGTLPFEEFIRIQRFLPRGHPALAALRASAVWPAAE